MTEVTDKMVQAARKSLSECSIALGGLPTAIEAALAAREPVNAGEFVMMLRIPIGPIDNDINVERRTAADAIDELAEALKPLAVLYVDDGDYSYTDISTYEGNVLTASCVRNARALLTRMGVKL